jgi:hypothetical protein
MALVRFGGGVSEIRGSIAGNVFARSRAGATIRNRIKPVNPPTLRQDAIQHIFSLAVASYRLLDANQIQEWADYAEQNFAGARLNALGEPYTPSGEQMFMEINMNSQLAGNNILEKPAANLVAPAFEDPFEIVALVQAAGALTQFTINATLLDGSPTSTLIVQATRVYKPSMRNFSGRYRWLDEVTDVGNIASDYNDYFESPSVMAGDVIAARARYIGVNGLSTDWQYDVGEITTAP